MNATAPLKPATAPRTAAGPVRPQDDAERWLARWGLAIAAGVLLAARTLSLDEGRVTLPLVHWPLPTTCTLRRLTGLACPGCGLTRSLIALAHQDPAAAWQFNPVGCLLFILLVFHVPLALLQEMLCWSGRPPLRLMPLYRVLAVLLVTGLVGQWLVRLMAGSF